MVTQLRRVIHCKWDVIVVGAGHNGLVAAAYLAKAGKKVCVLEKRSMVGGAAVTEEVFPGFRVSRASYVLSLLRPQIFKDLELDKYGLKVLTRNPGSFTPSSDGRSLIMWNDIKQTQKSIAQFSLKDAEMYPRYVQELQAIAKVFDPLLDQIPPNLDALLEPGIRIERRWKELKALWGCIRHILEPGTNVATFLQFLTAPATTVLGKYFESDIVKATLATDAIIGAAISPSCASSAYILLHHVMGAANGIKGAWGYVQGGMGMVSNAIAGVAEGAGAMIVVNTSVQRISVKANRVHGVQIENGDVIHCDCVLSNADPVQTMLHLAPSELLSDAVKSHFKQIWQCKSASTKINVALKGLPNFVCAPNLTSHESPMSHYSGTFHFASSLQEIEDAFSDYLRGYSSSRPIVELTIPSALDPTIAPRGQHVATIFVQYTPYSPKDGNWDARMKDRFAKRVFSVIDEFAPSFSSLIIDYEILTPVDLEKVFSLPKGNIFHGAMGLDQLFWSRPMHGMSDYRTPITGLYLCSAGSHPGGGVMGACGRNAALACLEDMR